MRATTTNSSIPILIFPATAFDNENDVTVLKICEPLIIPLLTPFNFIKVCRKNACF